MQHLTDEFFKFFMELAPNNNKDWFDVNRKRYKQHIKDPFDQLVGEVIEKMQEIDPRIEVQTKDCVFRINRDIRFSKDKTPYKMSRSAVISIGGKKRKDIPGVYFEVDCEKVRIYGGCFQPDKEQLLRIREEIAFNPENFVELIEDKEFKATFGEILGDKNARIAKELQEAGSKQELIYNKQFYWFAEYSPETALKDDFAEIIAAHFTIMKPLSDFLEKRVIG
ncbi:MAG: DUF2461 domain-containing protein [Flavobacteriales bacterium]|nr:DUF2461 domain-containing protein [Flavobacteriales bacterium]